MRHCHLSVSSLSMISLNSLNIFIMVVWKPLLKLTSDPPHRQFLLSASLLIYRSQFCFFQYVSFLKMRHSKLYIVLILDIFPASRAYILFHLYLFISWLCFTVLVTRGSPSSISCHFSCHSSGHVNSHPGATLDWVNIFFTVSSHASVGVTPGY